MSAAGNQATDAQPAGVWDTFACPCAGGGALGGCTFPFAERHDRLSGSQKGSA